MMCLPLQVYLIKPTTGENMLEKFGQKHLWCLVFLLSLY